MHETVRFCKLSDKIEDDKGEFVLILDKKQASNPLCNLSVTDHVNHYVNCGMSKNDAIKQTAKDRGVSKNEIYQQTLN